MRLWVLAVLLAMPGAAAAPVDLYWHLAGVQDAPLNTQEPEGEHVARYGLASHSACAPDIGISQAMSRSQHTWYSYAAPGFVEYDVDEDGKPRFHPERGLAVDLELDAQEQPVMVWHLAATGPEPRFDAAAAVVPNLVVWVTVREGDDISVGHAAFNTGRLVADGRVGPVTLHPGLSHEHVSVHSPGDLTVYRFEVPLRLHNTTIDQREGFNIRIDAMMDNPYCAGPDGYITPDLVSPYQGHGLWNKLHVGVKDALALEYMHLQVVGRDLVVHTSARSPFGGYDVLGEDLQLDGPALLPVQLMEDVRRVHVHGEPYGGWAYRPTWVINTTQAEPGLYSVQVRLSNLQGTAHVGANATFQMGDDTIRVCEVVSSGSKCTTHALAEGVEVPAVGPAAVLALLLLRRRR